MKNMIQLRLYGYAVRGTDRRDGSSFADYIILSNLDGEKYKDRIAKIVELYGRKGYDVEEQDISSDDKREYGSWNNQSGVPVELDLMELMSREQRAVAGEEC